METLKAFSNVPQEKVNSIKMKCQEQQLENYRSLLADMTGELDIESKKAEKFETEIIALNEARAKIIEAHAVEILQAKEQTEKEIAAKASEILAESGTPAVELEPASNANDASNQKMSEADFWDQYRAFDSRNDLSGKNQFYSEHKHVIGQ